jgi:hypothetical protein
MAEQGFTLNSSAFRNGGVIPATFTCDGEDVSPPLDWLHPPDRTTSFALILIDPDAPNGTFTHWVLWDIPAPTRGLERGYAAGTAGRNDFQGAGYGGPCPPANHGDHRYFFRLYALDIGSLGLAAGTRRDEVEEAMRGHILGQAELMGRYKRGATSR